MPQDPARKLEKKALRKHRNRGAGPPSTTTLAPLAMSTPPPTWPVYEALATGNWRQPSELVGVLVARRSERGEVASALYLVDLGCLGVKDATVMRFADEEQYQEMKTALPTLAPFEDVGLDLAAKIVRSALDYAASFGFRPHKDFFPAEPFLHDANPEAAPDEIPLGKDGKPFFISGPFDNVGKITAQLDRAVGPGNYNVLAAIPEGDLTPLLDELEPLDVDEHGHHHHHP